MSIASIRQKFIRRARGDNKQAMFLGNTLEIVQHRVQAFRFNVLQYIAAHHEIRRRWGRAEFLDGRIVINNAVILTQGLFQLTLATAVIQNFFGLV